MSTVLPPPRAALPPDVSRQYSFTDHSVNQPGTPQPGDRLDGEIDRTNSAVNQISDFLNETFDANGGLLPESIGFDHLDLAAVAEIEARITPQLAPFVTAARANRDEANISALDADNSAREAAIHAQSAAGSAARADTAADTALAVQASVATVAALVSADETDAENSANDAELAAAQAYNDARLAGAWAEYMDGGNEIPASYFAHTSITGQHWSSRWWANYAVTAISGGVDAINDAGDFWFNQLPGARTVVRALLYRATANQTTFPLTTPDLGGNTYTISAAAPEPVEVHANGVRLPSDTPNPGNGDWTLTPATSTLTFLTPLLAGTLVQVDVLSKPLTTTGFLPITGGTMTGPLTLAADPLSDLQAATKRYVDAIVTGSGFLPLTGGTITGPLVVNGPITGTGIGYDIGDIPGPIVSQGGIAALRPPAELLFQRNAFAATDGQDFRFRRASNFTGGTQSNINRTLVVDTGVGANDGTKNWGFLTKIATLSTTGSANTLSAYMQTWRSAGSNAQCWGAVVEMSDFTGAKSSISQPATSMEIDLGTSDLDDYVNLSKWGGSGGRHLIHFVVVRNQGSVENQVTHGLWFGTTNSYIDSIIGADLGGIGGSRTRQIVDARGFIPPTGVTDPVASVRMSTGQIIDFNGGSALSSPPGNYLQYTIAGPPRLRYVVGSTERMAIGEVGWMTLANGIGLFGSAAVTTKPVVTGSRAGNPALASLLAALASYGIVTDSTSA